MKGRRQGLTLVEVVLALGLLSLLLTGLFACLASTMRVDVLTREHLAASEVATRQLDALMTDPALPFVDDVSYFDVQQKSGSAAAPAALHVAVPLPAGWTASRPGRIETKVNPDGRGPDLLQITVSVSWRAADRSAQRLDLVSMRTR